MEQANSAADVTLPAPMGGVMRRTSLKRAAGAEVAGCNDASNVANLTDRCCKGEAESCAGDGGGGKPSA